jgi:hypothetical protein
MTSLTQQMEQLQQQQEILAHKIKEEEKEKKRRVENPLGVLNNYIVQDLERLSCYMKQNWIERNKDVLNVYIRNTQPRFEVIFEILKKQDARIAELEKMLLNK